MMVWILLGALSAVWLWAVYRDFKEAEREHYERMRIKAAWKKPVAKTMRRV